MMMQLLACVCLSLSLISYVESYTCNAEFGIDLSDGEEIDDGVIIKNGILYTSKNYKKVNGVKTGCICDINVCVRKCCPLGQYMTNRTCVDTDKPFVIPQVKRPNLNRFQFIFGNDCKHKKRRTRLQPAFGVDQDFIITESGKLFTPFDRVTFKLPDYCVDYIEDFEQIEALLCDYKNSNISDANIIGMLISMPFLLLTFLAYALLPARNLHQKCLMCYVITLFGAYLLLIIVQIYPNSLEFDTCKAMGLLCLFCFMVSFFFINVMSIDMWWTFSGLRGFSGTRKQKENKRFILYSAYAWGVPLLLVIIVTSLTHSESIPIDAWYNPGIGEGRCWFRCKSYLFLRNRKLLWHLFFSAEIGSLLYFFGPVTVIIVSNMVLFCITALKIKQTQKDTEMLTRQDSKRHMYERNKKRYYLFLKLMLAMGVNWSLEVLSWLVNWQTTNIPQAVWYITDFCNALYGMFIFFIFVFKKNILDLLKQRYLLVSGKPLLSTKSVIDGNESENSRRVQVEDNVNMYKNDKKSDFELR
ncbi:hypothetical protein FQR65_LT12134 [Abscondita terminalis]|nr:hypothetical protein FQR65_LT12134 [Abscondita terminalis]